jgi:hypothetical protein
MAKPGRRPMKKTIAAALGVSPAAFSRYVRNGCPSSDIAAARAWQARNVDPGQRLWRGTYVPYSPAPVDPLTQVAELFELAAGDFDAHEATLRAALRAVPYPDRHRVQVRVDVVKQLIAPALAAVADVLPTGGELSPTDAKYMGQIWYSVAAGEIVADGNRWLYDPSAAHLFHD